VCHTRVLEESNQNDLPLRFSDPCIFLSGWHVSVLFKQLISCLRTAHKDTRFIPSSHLQHEVCFLHWSFKESSSSDLHLVLHQNLWHKFTYACCTDKSSFRMLWTDPYEMSIYLLLFNHHIPIWCHDYINFGHTFIIPWCCWPAVTASLILW
jgi:hypothetical protein